MMQRPSWEIRVRDPRRERRVRLLMLMLVLAVPLAWFARDYMAQEEAAVLRVENEAMTRQQALQVRELDNLRRRLAIMESGEQLTQQAGEQTRQSIKLLESEIYRMQQELGTCKGIIGARRSDELQLRAFDVVPSTDPQRFYFKLFLGRSGQGSKAMDGSLSISLYGRQGSKTVSLPLAELSRDVPAEGLPFSLRNFLAFPEGGRLAELRLPQGFKPSEIRVKASVTGQKQALNKTFKWQAE